MPFTVTIHTSEWNHVQDSWDRQWSSQCFWGTTVGTHCVSVFHETRTWKSSFAGCYYLFHKQPEAECLFAFPKMTLSPHYMWAEGPGQSLADRACQRLRTGFTGSHTDVQVLSADGTFRSQHGWGMGGGAGHRRRRLKFHCKQKPDPETWIGSFHSCPNTRSVSAEILSTRSHRSRESCWCARSWTLRKLLAPFGSSNKSQFGLFINYSARLWRRPPFLDADLGRATF